LTRLRLVEPARSASCRIANLGWPVASLRRARWDPSGDRPRGGRFGTDPRRRQEDEPTHVDAVLNAYSDQGSIPCATIIRDFDGTAQQGGPVVVCGCVP